jgi:lipopolysaccharide/colanic/teichoic acid biosynthesis glycosyltransferase
MLDRTAFTEQTKTRDTGRWSRLAAALQRLGQRIDADRQALVIAHDVAAAALALPIAFMLRENALILPPKHLAYVISTLPLLAISALVATLLFGSHRAVWRYLGIPEIIRLAQMALFAVLVFQFGQFFIDRLDGMPRAVPPLQFLVMMFLMLTSRIAYGEFLRRTESNAGSLGKPVLLVGSGDGTALFIRLHQLGGQHEFQPVGILCDRVSTNRSIAGVPVLGDLADFDRVVANLRVQGMPPAAIVITRPHHELGYAAAEALIEKATDAGITTAELPDLMRFKGDTRDALAPPLPTAVAVYPRLKRTFDIVVSASVLVVTAPVLMIAAIAVALFIQRPVLFVQLRPGLAGEAFKLLKFRTMRDPLDAKGNRLTDAERTPLAGRILRRTRLDELLQFWNVLMGDMAIIGPRPLVAADLDAMPDKGEARSRSRPGITGWAQVNGGHQLTPEEKLALDLYYSEHASLRFDARIVWRTVMMMLFGERRDDKAIATALKSFAQAG